MRQPIAMQLHQKAKSNYSLNNHSFWTDGAIFKAFKSLKLLNLTNIVNFVANRLEMAAL